MRVVQARGRGGPEVLQLMDRPDIEPGRGRARVRSEAIGVAYGDVMRRRGVLAPPWAFTPGYDLVGVVDALGPGVSPALLGRRVAAYMPMGGFGAYAEQVSMKASQLVPVPDGLAPDAAVALGLNYITGRQILRMLALSEGDSLLVHGAAGGVGTALLELGAQQGLRLFGTASSGKHERLRAYGCTPIDYRSEDFVQRLAELAPDGVHAALDPIGGAHLLRSAATLRAGGALVVFGVSGDVQAGMWGVLKGLWSAARVWAGGARLRPYGVGVNTGLAQVRADWEALLLLGAEGRLSPVIGARVPFEEVREAHALMDQRAVQGKVVLVCGVPPGRTPPPSQRGPSCAS